MRNTPPGSPAPVQFVKKVQLAGTIDARQAELHTLLVIVIRDAAPCAPWQRQSDQVLRPLKADGGSKKYVSCGGRTHAQLPAVDLKVTPLTTRAN